MFIIARDVEKQLTIIQNRKTQQLAKTKHSTVGQKLQKHELQIMSVEIVV